MCGDSSILPDSAGINEGKQRRFAMGFGAREIEVQMKLIKQLVLLMSAIALGTAARAGEPGETKERIGVYDSRAVAVAFAGSEAHNKSMEPLLAEHRKAKAAD